MARLSLKCCFSLVELETCSMVRETKREMTWNVCETKLVKLIGFKANDVSMIVAAHVGVGLCGKEGAQAARSGDFALAEFRPRGAVVKSWMLTMSAFLQMLHEFSQHTGDLNMFNLGLGLRQSFVSFELGKPHFHTCKGLIRFKMRFQNGSTTEQPKNCSFCLNERGTLPTTSWWPTSSWFWTVLRLLRRAVFGHGREAYRRNSMVCIYSFYKKLVCTFEKLCKIFEAFSNYKVKAEVTSRRNSIAQSLRGQCSGSLCLNKESGECVDHDLGGCS